MKAGWLGLSFLLLLASKIQAQDKWDLQRAVAYALEHNISVKQADLQIRYAELDLKQSRSARLPSLNISTNSGLSLGRRENPTTGVLQDQNFFSTNFGLQSGVTLFNWFSLKNRSEANRINIEAGKAQLKKIQDDIALNVAVAYLQVLLTKEQVKVNAVQVEQDRSQLDLTRKKVIAGSLPELTAADLEAQLAEDSTTLISSQSTFQQFTLQLKALLNLDAAAPFEVDTPPVGSIPVENITDLQPELVYASAVKNLPQQKVNELRIQSALKSERAARGNMFPTISAYANLGTNYIYYRLPKYAPVIMGFDTIGLRVNNNGNFYVIEAPVIGQGAKNGYITPSPFGNQLSANFGQGIGLGIQVPIFNARSARSNWDRTKLNITGLEFQQDLDRQTLKQDIYKAYNDAVSAIQRFNASKKTVEAAAKAYDFAQKRYNVNLLSSYDLINSQNRLARARINMLSAQFEFVFRMKLLEFYKGQGLKL